jgi:hypothetical protein
LKLNAIAVELKDVASDPYREKNKFSESVVKQLIRQGEDRKASIEETKLLQNEIDKMKLTQKKQRETILRMTKGLKYLEEN